MFGECHMHIFMNGVNYREAVQLHKNGVQEADIRKKLEQYKVKKEGAFMFGECHMHIFMNGVNYREAVQLHKNGVQEADIRKKLEQYKACGITFFMFGECHMHIFMNGVNYREAVQLHKNGVQEADIRKKLEQYKACGITFLRDGGDGLGVSARAAKIAPEYGIAYRTPIFAIHKKGHYGGIVGYGFEDWREYHSLVKQVRAEGGDPEYGIAYRTPIFAIHKKGHYGGIVGYGFEDWREYHSLVKQVRAEGGDFIKVMFSGIMDFDREGAVTEPSLSENEIREMIHIAHEEGFAVMAHVNGADAVRAAVCACFQESWILTGRER